ncbi:MAG: hypothetical protein KDJ26_08145 [Alphaproteobacteria bacterium]|nr:hypothetical protein [Alphaproteobacteria bacterium]MCB9984652.1 hypothetical protein [Micavibrio sp.]
MEDTDKHQILIDNLKSIRDSLPYDNYDPVKNRDLAIEQIKVIRSYLGSIGATPNIFSPISEVLHSLEGLEVGRQSKLLKPEPLKFSDRDRMLYAMASASFDFLKDNENLAAKEAARVILKMMKKFEFPDFRERNDTERNLTDQAPDNIQLENWAKSCRNGRKGKTAKTQYLQGKKFLEDTFQSGEISPIKIIERYFDGSCFGDTDPYRVK